MSQNEEPDESNEFGGFSYIGGMPFPVPTEAVEAMRKRRDHDVMRAQATEIERRQFLEGLETDELIIVRELIRVAADEPGAANYLIGWMNAMIQYVHKKCHSCGGDHLEDMFNHEALEDEPEAESGAESEQGDPSLESDDAVELQKQVELEKEMGRWNVRPALGNSEGVVCKGCGTWYRSLADRKLKEDCGQCIINTKWGGGAPNA